MTYTRTPYVHEIISRLSKQSGLKGIVNPAQVRVLCGHIRELLADRANVVLETDWLRLQEYTQVCRCFTVVEAERIYYLYAQYKYPWVRVSRYRKGKQARV